MNHQQPPLTGSYYGPPVYAYPPPPPNPNRPRRLLTVLIRSFIISCVIIGLVVLILWIIYRPQKMQIAVASASLRTFNLSSADPAGNRFLSFNLSANLSVRNPNRRVGIYYDWLEAHAVYEGERFGWVPLPAFYEGRKSTFVLPVEFEGRSAVLVGDGGAENFRRENSSGTFPVDLWVYGRVRYKFGAAVTRRYVMRALCELRLPLAKAGFSPTDCHVRDF